jgi:cytochrome c
MKRSAVLLFVVVLLAVSLAIAGDKEMKHKEEMKASFMRGKELFMDTSLGTNGMSCNSCHAEGGTMPGKMGDMEIPPFKHVGKKYPGYFKMAEKVMTLDQVINFCVTTPMEGKALAWDDQRMADLATYIVWVDSAKEKKEKEYKEKKEEKKE